MNLQERRGNLAVTDQETFGKDGRTTPDGAIREIAETVPQFVALHRDLHPHPELAFDERRTSDLVSATLKSCGLPARRGLARTGGFWGRTSTSA